MAFCSASGADQSISFRRRRITSLGSFTPQSLTLQFLSECKSSSSMVSCNRTSIFGGLLNFLTWGTEVPFL